MKSAAKDWELYERFIARLMVDQISTDLCVTPNARIKGTISRRIRQLDVLIDRRHDTDNSRRIIVDAKMRRRKIDVVQVEAFEGLMKDVEATHGVLVCPIGHTKAAEKRAQRAITIRLVPLSYLLHFDPSQWDRCQKKGCDRGHVFWDGYPELSLGGVLRFVHSVGKCDRCGRFHVKCYRCGELFSMTDESDYQCRCKPLWFWLSSIEQDPKGRHSAELHVVLANGRVITVDRRPM
jgi:restriction endonuclease